MKSRQFHFKEFHFKSFSSGSFNKVWWKIVYFSRYFIIIWNCLIFCNQFPRGWLLFLLGMALQFSKMTVYQTASDEALHFSKKVKRLGYCFRIRKFVRIIKKNTKRLWIKGRLWNFSEASCFIITFYIQK